MWHVNNQQFLFADPNKQEYIVKIIGSDLFNYFKRAGLDAMELSGQATQLIGDIINQHEGDLSNEDVQAMIEAGKTPKFPVFENPGEKDPSKLIYKPKMKINETGDGAELSVIPADLDGAYDYVADVHSMSMGADIQLQRAIQIAINGLTGNPVVLQLLQQEGVTPNIKDLLISQYEGLGLTDADRFFQTQQPSGQFGQGSGPVPSLPNQGIPANSSAGPAGNVGPQGPQPQGLPQQGGVLPGNGANVQPMPSMQGAAGPVQ